MIDVSFLLTKFDRAIAQGTAPDSAFVALQRFTESLVGVKLFTIMTVDMHAELARRAFSSNPTAYPVSGTKPITYNDWFSVVHKERRPFVANTIEDIAKVFPDHELIHSLGCASVINLPVVIADELVATVNILHEAQYYTPERVQLFATHGSLPAKLAYLAAARSKS